MDLRKRLKALMGIKEEQRSVSDDQLEIEYETELANIDSYRRRLVALHKEWEKELASERAEANALTDEDGQEYNPAKFVVERMGLSNKATMALKQMGLLTFGDFEHADAKALEDQAIIGRKNVQTIDRILEAYGLNPLASGQTENDAQPEDEAQDTEQEPAVQEESVTDEETAAAPAEALSEEVVEDDGKEVGATEDEPEFEEELDLDDDDAVF